MVNQRLSAEFRGSFLTKKSWEGRVHSIYSKAVNLLHPSGYLVSIVNTLDQMSDYGLGLADFKLLLSGVGPGSKFLWENDKIIFPDIIVDIARSSLWSGAVSCKNTGLPFPTNQLQKAFINFAKEEGLSPLVTKKKGNLYSNAAEKMINNAIETAMHQSSLEIDLSLFVGLGIGFTPSGDDFLAGVMLYETISGVCLINRESVRTRLQGTTEGGRTLLSLALRNSFPFYLKQFAGSLLKRKLSADEIVSKAVIHGSTSGSDALTGFLWASKKYRKIQKYN